MALRSWSKNRGLQQRRDIENQRRDVAETEHPDAATLLHDVATLLRRSGLVLGGLLAHFEAIMEAFKAQTIGIEKEEDL